MEEYSFSWVLKVVATRQFLLPFLPTYVTSNPKNIIYLSNTNNKLSFHHTQHKSFKDLFSKILSENQYKIKFHPSDYILLYAITKTERIRLKESDLKEAQESFEKTGCLFIQPARPRASDYEVFYILSLEYTRSQYVSSLFKQVNYEKANFFDTRIFEQASDIANTLMSIIESHTKKRVMIIEIEFLEDIDKKIWVSFIRDLKIAEPVLCLHYIIKTPNDLKIIPIKPSSLSKASKLAKGARLIEKQRSKPPIDYPFVKGRIRNKKSDLEADISIQIPELNRGEVSPDLGQEFKNSKRYSIRKSGIIKASTPQARSPSNLEKMRERALRDEIMKSPEIKSRYRLNGLIGLIGVRVENPHSRSSSESSSKAKKAHSQPRLILRYGSPRSLTPRHK